MKTNGLKEVNKMKNYKLNKNTKRSTMGKYEPMYIEYVCKRVAESLQNEIEIEKAKTALNKLSKQIHEMMYVETIHLRNSKYNAWFELKNNKRTINFKAGSMTMTFNGTEWVIKTKNPEAEGAGGVKNV